MFTVNQEKYFDFGLTFGAEKLEELDEIKIHHETLHRLLIKKGLWQRKGMKGGSSSLFA